MIFSQQLKPCDMEKLKLVENSSHIYVGKKFEVLLRDLPEIKMIRIAPNNPALDVHTFILGFVDNASFSNKEKDAKARQRVTLYLKGNNRLINPNELTRADITTSKAIKQYGHMIIGPIIN